MLTTYVRDRVYNYGFTVGSGRGGGRNFLRPSDFALGSEGSLYVTSKGFEFLPLQGLTKCTMDHRFLWDDRGTDFGEGQCPMPMSVAVDSDENVYVCDDYTNRIFKWDSDGNPLGGWDPKPSVEGDPNDHLMSIPNAHKISFNYYLRKTDPTRGAGDGELNGPSGIEFDRDDNLYVVDSRNHRVQVFTKDGKFLHKWGSFGTGEGQFNLPWGIAIDGSGDVYVADWKNDRVQKFAPDGKFLATFGRPGEGEGELGRPAGVAVDRDGDVYVAEWGNNRVTVYDSKGEFLTAFYGDAEDLSPANLDRVNANPDYIKARKRADRSTEWKLWLPVAVNVDDQGNIMILENRTQRIQVYIKEQGWVDPQYNL